MPTLPSAPAASASPVEGWRIAHSESSLGWGGQERRIFSELSGFRRRGSRVALVAPAAAKIFDQAQTAGIHAVELNTARLQFPFAVLRLARWLREQQISILNPHSSRDSWIAGLAGRWARVPFIVRTRHFDVPIGNPRVSRVVYRNLCDHVMTTSPVVTARFRELFQLPESRVSTVPTGIDLELFSPTGPRADLSLPETAARRPLIGLIAVIRRAKGHLTLMDAARLLKDEGVLAHYVMVGEGPSRAPVDQRIGELGLQSDVTFLGHREDIPAVLRTLSLLVIPSLHEGIPQVALQALATKTPVIGSDVGGIPEVIRPGETGRIVPAGDAVALARAIRDTLRQPEATLALSERGRARVEAHHSLAHMLDTLDALYQRHLAAPGP